jgi:hypothetical protein
MLSQEVELPLVLAALPVAAAVLTLLLEDRFILGGGWVPLLLAGSTPSMRWPPASGEQALAFSSMERRHRTTQSRVGAW